MKLKELTKAMFYKALAPYGDDLFLVGGFSSYRDVVILWDNDHDERILGVIDSLATSDWLERLVAVYKHAGPLMLFWDGEIPKDLPDSITMHNSMADEGEDKTRWRISNYSVEREEF